MMDRSSSLARIAEWNNELEFINKQYELFKEIFLSLNDRLAILEMNIDNERKAVKGDL